MIADADTSANDKQKYQGYLNTALTKKADLITKRDNAKADFAKAEKA